MKAAMMYGTGKIGRGFIARLFCRSGYDFVCMDVNVSPVNPLSEAGEDFLSRMIQEGNPV